jgi:hypothetical protein
MLAQNFKTPADLKVNDIEFESLVKVLGMLERGEIEYGLPGDSGELRAFNMSWANCGTVGCIAGWANCISDGRAFPDCAGSTLWFHHQPAKLRELFSPRNTGTLLSKITPAAAAIALRSFLTNGEPRWAEALAE